MKKANLIMFLAYVEVFIYLLLFNSCISAPIKLKKTYRPLNVFKQEVAEQRVSIPKSEKNYTYIFNY